VRSALGLKKRLAACALLEQKMVQEIFVVVFARIFGVVKERK
jgi:hypothetical protein